MVVRVLLESARRTSDDLRHGVGGALGVAGLEEAQDQHQELGVVLRQPGAQHCADEGSGVAVGGVDRLHDTSGSQALAAADAALAERLQPFMAQLPGFPFGTDFSKDELNILKALQALKSSTENPLALVKSVIHSVFSDSEVPQRYLERMGFDEVHGLKERFMKRLFMGNF